MLSPDEKEKLRIHKDLESKTRSKLDYRVAEKIEKRLAELGEINYALSMLSEKSAKSRLTDEMVASAFLLIETMLKKLGYAPVRSGKTFGTAYVRRSKPEVSKDKRSTEVRVRCEQPTAQDFSRQRIIEDHVKMLYSLGFISPKLIRDLQQSNEGADLSLLEPDQTVGYEAVEAFSEGQKLYQKLKEKR